MDTMNERVTAAIRASGLSASEVGRRLGVSPEADGFLVPPRWLPCSPSCSAPSC